MAGLVLEQEGMVRRGGVQDFFMGRPFFRQVIVVVAFGQNPLALRNLIFLYKLPDLFCDFFKADHFVQRNLQKGIGKAGKVTVRVEKGGQHRTSVQIDFFTSRTSLKFQLLPFSHSENSSVFR